MLDTLFGNSTAARILLHLREKGEAHATEIARRLRIPLNMVQKQLGKFEWGGILESRKEGKARIYGWNRDWPLHRELAQILVKASRLRRRIREERVLDPADGTSLSIRERIHLVEKLTLEAEGLE